MANSLKFSDILKFIPFNLFIEVEGRVEMVSSICLNAKEIYTFEGSNPYTIEEITPLLKPIKSPDLNRKLERKTLNYSYYNRLIEFCSDVDFLIQKGLAKEKS